MSVTVHTITNISRDNPNGQVPAIVDRVYQDWLNGGQSGIVTGCEVSSVGGSTLSITDGWGFAKGAIFSIEAQSITATMSTSGTVNGRLKLRVDTGSQTGAFVTEAAATLPALTQEDINGSGTIYDVPLATYSVSEITISDVTSAATVVNSLYSLITALQTTAASLSSTKQNNITGGASTITSSNLTASRALTSNASGKVTVSSVTSTELGYLSGVTSAVQTQLNAKVATTRTVNGHALSSNVTVSKTDVGLGNVDNEKQMPIAGGTFTGNAYAQSVNGNQARLRNIVVQNSSGTAQSTNYIIMRRK